MQNPHDAQQRYVQVTSRFMLISSDVPCQRGREKVGVCGDTGDTGEVEALRPSGVGGSQGSGARRDGGTGMHFFHRWSE